MLTSLLEPTSGGYVALIVTQQVACRGQDYSFFAVAIPTADLCAQGDAADPKDIYHLTDFIPFRGPACVL